MSFALSGEEWLAKGDSCYGQRAVGSQGDRADRELALNAVNAYRLAMAEPNVERLAATRLLRSLYFQGCFAFTDAQDRLQIFTEARQIGERMVDKYPSDPELAYWYTVNLSLWAKESGVIAAIRSGVPDKIRKLSVSVTSHSTPSPALAGLYQVLGRMNHLLPKIPFFLPWPDKEKAERYLLKAVQLDPDDLANTLFLAEFYRDMGRFDDARRVISPVLKRAPRASQELEDRRNLWKLRELEVALHQPGNAERMAMAASQTEENLR
ncbi:MAG TPA: tetratricopeptide repeat protein [Fibrobacteraceae bacterium]|nr:tetratricopeptide repeat protein [Fibrobacteraceae bacterium]